jgi:hypothetical protein
MGLEEFFYASQSVASIAVVGSLIYLGLQLRAGDRNQRALMQQGRADRASKAALALASPELARIWHKGLAGDSDLTRDEFSQWMLLCRAAFLSGEDSFLQYHAGLLAPAAFASYEAGARYFMASAGIRVAWRLARGQFGSDYRAFGDALVASTPLDGKTDAYVDWQQLLQSELATKQVNA